MDAIEFLDTLDRLTNSDPKTLSKIEELAKIKDNRTIVQLVDKWRKDHPSYTRQDKFLKQYPQTLLNPEGVIHMCPVYILGKAPSNDGKKCTIMCSDCKRCFWKEDLK